MPSNDLSAKQIMKALKIEESDRTAYDILLSFLQDAYSRGYDEAFQKYARYDEDMGK